MKKSPTNMIKNTNLSYTDVVAAFGTSYLDSLPSCLYALVPFRQLLPYRYIEQI